MKYSFKTGLIKTIKNLGVVLGVPALAFLINNYTQWLPQQYVNSPLAIAIISAIAYMLKNYNSNKK